MIKATEKRKQSKYANRFLEEKISLDKQEMINIFFYSIKDEKY